METTWEGLSEVEKEGQVFDALVQIDLQHADPNFSSRFNQAKAMTTDQADGMRLDMQMFNRVKQLRDEGKMLTAEQLRSKAQGMIKLNSEEMRKALQDFKEELKQPQQT